MKKAYTFGAFVLLLLIVLFMSGVGQEGYFTFYSGMPGIPKTYISPHFIRNTGCYQEGASPTMFI